MSRNETIPRGALLEGAALSRHLRAVASECRWAGRARMKGASRCIRSLELSIAMLRVRRDTEELTPAGMWLTDNARMIEEACVTLAEELRGVPRLPARRGEARVERLAREWLSHVEAQADGASLEKAAAAWQSAQPLTEMELCVLPLAVRRALLLLLEDLARQSVETEKERTRAEATLAIEGKNHMDAYWERVSYILQEREDADGLSELDRHLLELGMTSTEAAEREHDRQTRACLWTANAIASLKALSSLEWRGRQESLSSIHQWLMRDPTGVYPRMDFASRGMYRRRVSKLARAFGVSEAVVARKAIACAEESADDTIPALSRHVGYYLMDEGQPILWEALGKTPFSLKLSRWMGQSASIAYVALIMLGSLGVTVLLWLLGVKSWLVAPALLIAGEGFRQIAGLVIHRLSPPRRMARLAPDQLEEGAVLVAVPTLLTSRAQALEMVRHLSVLRLANPESRLSFMLLADFKDGPAAVETTDADITEAALSAIRALNDVWNGGFYYLHREREWNESAGRFMGHERKRGALVALNELILTGECDSRFTAASCDPKELKDAFAVVITLDADTQLPPGTPLELAGMLQHPLNRPCEAKGKRRGCAVIQPRMETSAATIHTRIQRVFGGDGGFDPYITAFSDIYQNLCGEGSFAGKGVYDVRAFTERSDGKIKDNTVLSHDLLEGALVGASLACDVALYDSQPASLSGWMKRTHRWTRGDWQLLPWLIPFRKKSDGSGWERNPLSMLNQFKIYDNLRRSLTPLASVLLLIFGVAKNELAAVLSGLLLPHARALLPVSLKSLTSALARVALTPYDAYIQLDAALRTVWRVLISKKRLLEWVPSAEAERQRPPDSVLRFWPNYLSAALLIGASLYAPLYLIGTIPLAALWALAPLMEKWLNAKESPAEPISEKDRALLMDIARRTFRFFEETVTQKTNYLPPDNLQVEPPRGCAPRTSPTNIGMYLLSCVSAFELSILEADEAARRIEKTVASMEKMEKWNGHLYNWYDVYTLAPLPRRYVSSVDGGNLAGCLLLTAQALRSRFEELDASLVPLPARIDALAAAMDFAKLYDPNADLFYIGVNAETGLPGNSHYDLLASEARLLSYIALMRREVPIKHWRRLGRGMTKTRKGATLLSWSGTLFEYLLPTLFLESPSGTLLGDACLHAALLQVSAFGDAPWGVSESGYYAFDPALLYQYRAFGLQGLALRSEREERVITPYASALALEAVPAEAVKNLRRMADLGWLSPLGFYEAADYGRERIAEGTEYMLVRSHMAHHQGMVIASICNLLTGGALRRHFHSLPQAQAYALLLEERKPTRAMLRNTAKTKLPEFVKGEEGTPLRRVTLMEFPPEAQALYGGGTTLVCDSRGGGYVSHNGVLLTRRRLDPLYEGGMQIYLRYENGDVLRVNKAEEIWFDRHCAIYRMEHGGLEAELVCFVSPLDGAAVHLLRLHASPEHNVSVEVASFFEVCLSSQAEDESHPAFRNLSVETQRVSDTAAVARRRTKHKGESYPLLVHAVGMEKEGQAQLETSRMAFLSRGERLKRPASLERPMDISAGETGSVLDPCMSLRVQVAVEAGAVASVWFVTAGVRDTQRAASLAAQYENRDHVLRALELSGTQAGVAAKYLGLDTAAQIAAQKMVPWLLLPLAVGPAPREGRSALWRFGISGDLPVIVVTVSHESHLPLARSALKAHAYLRGLGVWSDLAIVCRQAEEYYRPALEALRSLLASSPSRDLIGQGAGVHLIDAAAHGEETVSHLLSHASLCLRGGEGSLAAQLSQMRRSISMRGAAESPWPKQNPPDSGSLALFNGFGGFRADGGYVVRSMPPMPWCNVLANAGFGTVVTERGAGYTWLGNSRMRRVTAFASDPVRDQRQEGMWLRDEVNGRFVSVTERALVTHGFGFSRFESEGLGLRLTLDVFVDEELPVKCLLLEVHNPGTESRDLSVTAAVRWLLGSLLHDAAMVSAVAVGGVAWAKSPAFPESAFLMFPGRETEASPDGAAFFGAGGMENPRGMAMRGLENTACDLPAGIIRTRFDLDGGGTEAVCCLLGAGRFDEALKAYQNGGVQLRLAHIRKAWQSRQEALIARVPDAAVSVLAGGWLPYQALSSRIWAHAGFYQAGGAIGFRDQLQDMLAFRFTEPERVRSHLLDAAGHQFEAGDVQHWWHPPALGVRTRITDDRLFLPYVTAAYVRATGDTSILWEEIPFLKNVEIPEGREDWYGEAEVSEAKGTLHEHNLRAIRSVRLGIQGLPLMGAGDWNDGMSAVGAEGRGESVWLGFFLAVVLREYAVYCEPGEARQLMSQRGALMRNLEQHAWDGDWYVRAWFDDGRPLGGKESAECKIDLVVQAWAMMAGAEHGPEAMHAALEKLVDEEAGIIKLLDPPFDGKTEPGYIRAYPRGVRENGGQYTHAAVWFVMACAKMGEVETAWKLFYMLLPTTHGRDERAVLRYRVEPYVIAADIAGGDHPGRGGWSWYTGSASLLWSVCLETLLGFQKEGNRVRLVPSAPKEWKGYAVEYSYGSARYVLRAQRGGTDAGWVELVDDGQMHEVVFAL